MSVVRFEIKFDNPHAAYVCGQHVTGSVIVILQKEKTIRAIDLKFFGEAKVEWSETNSETTVYYSNKKVYLENTITVAGGSSADITLPSGTTIYPFRYILPLNIPSSFENKHGYVRYTAKAAIRRRGLFDNKCKSAFSVLCPLDLNNEPDILKPVRVKKEKSLYFGLSGSSTNLDVSLPFSGYVPGQKCQGNFEFQNRTTNCISLKAYIIQNITLKAKGGRKKLERNKICRENVGEVFSQGSRTYSVCFQIPAVPNSYLHNCTFIDISYCFEIKAEISGMHRNFCVSVPIVIGSIPPRTQFHNLTQWELNSSLPNNDELAEVTYSKEEEAAQSSSSASSINENPFFSYPEMPPPSYEEAVGGAVDIRNNEDDESVEGAMAFTPRYPVYSFK